jgi:hypothetical protein
MFQSFLLILEVKNYRGTLSFDPKFQQVIQEVEDLKAVSLPDPILQVSMQEYKLMEWFKKKSLPFLPIEKLVVMVNQKSIIKASSNSSLVEQYVIKAPALNFRIQSLVKKYPNHILSKKELNRISSHLLKDDTPSENSQVQQLGIKPSDIIPGVFCPGCVNTSIMERIHGGWECHRCSLLSSDAHLPALEDHALLINPFISCKEVQEFLLLKNPFVARRIIQSLDSEYINSTKGRKYNIPIS